MQYPLVYNGIKQGFKKTGKDKHLGIDEGWNLLYGGTTAKIYSVEKGKVHSIQHQHTGGNVIIIKHNNGFFSEYGHLSKIVVREGESVDRNQYIGNMGHTGYYQDEDGNWKQVPPHLHFGLYKGDTFSYGVNNWVNPIDYLELYPYQKFSANTIKTYGSKLKYYKEAPEKGVYKTKYNMNIRKSPNGAIVKVKDCTSAMKKVLVSQKANDNAVIKKGTNFTALDVVKSGNSYWAKNYSGYICIKDNKNEYCTKV